MTPGHAGEALARALARSLRAELVETHISWVLLGQAEAWKLKKPLRTAFLDYRDPAERARLCAEEVRLNARLAPGLYLGVVAVTGPPEAPQLGGEGPVIDHAVHMRRFPPDALFSERLAQGRLGEDALDASADLLARFHLQAPHAPDGSPYGLPRLRRDAALGVLDGARSAAEPLAWEALHAWIDASADGLHPLWSARRAGGHVREVHGDLHLANLLWLHEGPAAFDAVEFDPALRWIDVIDDIAFPVMDLAARGRRDLAMRLLVRWLDGTGEHEGLPALRFALVYRALVRAAVAVLRGGQARDEACRYLAAAQAWTFPGTPRLTLMHGLPGAGKSWVSQQLLQTECAIRLRSDVERKRLHGLPADADSRAAGLDIYTPEAGARTYAELLRLARIALGAGWPVILDAAHARREERGQALALARELGVPVRIVACEAPWAVLRERVARRQGDASEADLAVLDKLAAAQQPFSPEESALVLRWATGPGAAGQAPQQRSASAASADPKPTV